MTVLDAISLAFLLLPIVDWLAVYVLSRVVRRWPDIGTLRERRRVAVAIALVTTIFAGLGFARLEGVPIAPELAGTVIFVGVLGLSLVNLAFLVAYWRAAFR